jgi:pyruvate,water dikinase
VFELDTPELAGALRGDPGPDADEIARRAGERVRQAAAEPPNVLGPVMAPPDTSVFPPGIRRVMNIIIASVSNLEVDPNVAVPDLHGLGIGAGVHRGIARVATDPDQVLDAMEPGDVLVAPWTAPTYNAVLAIAGAVVVQEGGLLCHAAVMARELGIPAVIGCRGAMDRIGDGQLIEVDADGGVVRVVEPS